MISYDILVLGAGPEGLLAALRGAKAGKKCLVLENSGWAGGLNSSFPAGRFRFERWPETVQEKEGEDKAGMLYSLLQPLGLWEELNWQKKPAQEYRVLSKDGVLDAVIPTGEQALVEKMAGLCTGGRESMERFLKLSHEAEQAMEYRHSHNGKIGLFTLLRRWGGFARCGGYTVGQVLDALEMPPRARACVENSVYAMGGDAASMNFAQFAPAFLQSVRDDTLEPEKGLETLSMALEKALRQQGGQVWYNCPVRRILEEDGRVVGVLLADGYRVQARQVIATTSPWQLLSEDGLVHIPEDKHGRLATRRAGPVALSVWLGLNRSAQALGIRQNKMYLRDFAEEEKEIEARSNIAKTSGCMAICKPIPGENGRPSGACVLQVHAMYPSTAWEEISAENYTAIRDAAAEKLISSLEKSFHLRLKNAVEEIAVAGPAEYAAWTGSVTGSVFPLAPEPWEGPLAWQKGEKEEEWLSGLRFCAGAVGAVSLPERMRSAELAASEAIAQLEKEA